MKAAKYIPYASSGKADMTQAEVAALFGVTRARIQQMEQNALKKIRKAVAKEAAAAGMTIRQWLLCDDE